MFISPRKKFGVCISLDPLIETSSMLYSPKKDQSSVAPKLYDYAMPAKSPSEAK